VGLSGAGGEVQARKDANEECESALQGEQPAPALHVGVVSHLQDTSGQQRADNVGNGERDPEERKTNGEFRRGVVVRQVEDSVRDKTSLDETQESACGEEA